MRKYWDNIKQYLGKDKGLALVYLLIKLRILFILSWVSVKKSKHEYFSQFKLELQPIHLFIYIMVYLSLDFNFKLSMVIVFILIMLLVKKKHLTLFLIRGTDSSKALLNRQGRAQARWSKWGRGPHTHGR